MSAELFIVASALIGAGAASESDTATRAEFLASDGVHEVQPLRAQTGFAAGLSAGSGGALRQDANAEAQTREGADRPTRLTRETMLIVELVLDRVTLSPSTIAHGDENDPLLPLGELARLLELDLSADPAAGTASGRIGQAEQVLAIDLQQGLATLGSERIVLGANDAGLNDSDLFLRASLLEQLLPLAIAMDVDNFIVTLTPSEPLPVQQRAARGERRANFGALAGMEGEEEALPLAAPFSWFDIPSTDFALHLGRAGREEGLYRRFEARSAGDLMKSSFHGFVGTDDNGRAAAATLRLDRRSASRALFGPLSLSYAGIGDIYTPSLSLGARSRGGSGISFSNAAVGDTSVFQRITLRGELPLGYDAELYVNDVLRGSQDRARSGRYEFADVPLVRGRNVIRLVTYGPRGQRDEQVQIVNVGGGQLAKEVFEVSGGMVFQDRPVVRFDDGEVIADEDVLEELFPSTALDRGKMRAILSLGYGLSSRVTLTGGAARFTDPLGERRMQMSGGLRTALFGLAIEADAARELGSDSGSGRAIALGVAGRALGIGFTARHREYDGRFTDEVNVLFDPSKPLVRMSELQADTVTRLPALGSVPLSGRVQRGEFADGSRQYLGQARTSLSLLGNFIALSSQYYRLDPVDGPSLTDWSLDMAATRRIGLDLLLRGSAQMDLEEGRVRAFDLTADYRLSDRLGLRAGLVRSVGQRRDWNALLGINAHLPVFDIALTGGYSTARRDWTLGLQLNVGTLFDPVSRRMRLARPGVSTGASVAMIAFRDEDGDGIADAGEEGLAGVRLAAAGDPVESDDEGRAFLTGLGTSHRTLFRVDPSGVDDIFLDGASGAMAFEARAGKVVRADYPMRTLSEAIVKLVVQRADGSEIGLSAVDFALVSDEGRRISARTEFDGSAVFSGLAAGRYQVDLDEEQAARLGMRLAAPVALTVSPKGGSVSGEGVILFEGRGS